MESKMQSDNILMRLVYMVIFMFLHTLLRPAVIVVAALQYIHFLVKKSKHPILIGFGHSLAQYTYEIVSFVTFNTEDLPFPFSRWPN